jgi:cytochrome c
VRAAGGGYERRKRGYGENPMLRPALLIGLLIASLAVARPSLAAGDAAEGEKVFKRYCTTCHIATAKGSPRQGPTLFGVVGRKAGSVEGFRYTNANRNSNLVWTEDQLDKYLTDPRAVVPGTSMAFAGVNNADDRQNLIAYLATLK